MKSITNLFCCCCSSQDSVVDCTETRSVRGDFTEAGRSVGRYVDVDDVGGDLCSQVWRDGSSFGEVGLVKARQVTRTKNRAIFTDSSGGSDLYAQVVKPFNHGQSLGGSHARVVGSASGFSSMGLIKVPQQSPQTGGFLQGAHVRAPVTCPRRGDYCLVGDHGSSQVSRDEPAVSSINHGQSLGRHVRVVGSASDFSSTRLIKVLQQPPQTGGFLQGAHVRAPVTCPRRGDYCLVGAPGSSQVPRDEPFVVSSGGSDYCFVGATGSSQVSREEPVESDYCFVGASGSSQVSREEPVVSSIESDYCLVGATGSSQVSRSEPFVVSSEGSGYRPVGEAAGSSGVSGDGYYAKVVKPAKTVHNVGSGCAVSRVSSFDSRSLIRVPQHAGQRGNFMQAYETPVASQVRRDYCLAGSSSSHGLREAFVSTGSGYCFPGDDGGDYQSIDDFVACQEGDYSCVDDLVGGISTSSRLSASHDSDGVN
ncbi:hypothetical protein [Candidatus Ichthyocystis hellenicum]|uniref:hypothetical protein n=1 Tax=Candidatus Ichthyocystis hellenicum TaxID=1561003 RepID=UPI000B8460DB|nr:hypothetical protein [Candidatus Ichthyocystis hellenicum]